jgi:hypothetical protein
VSSIQKQVTPFSQQGVSCAAQEKKKITITKQKQNKPTNKHLNFSKMQAVNMNAIQ